MNMEDVRSKTTDELRALDAELRDELFRMKLKHAAGHLDKPAQIRDVRRNIARVATILVERR